MNPLFDPSRMDVALGDYRIGKSQALRNISMHLRTQDFRRQLGGRMLALDRASMKEKLPACDYFASRKVDGEFTVLIAEGDYVCTVNPGGTVRAGLPLMKEAAELLGKAKLKKAMIVGELYVARTDKRPRVHDVSRVARAPVNSDEVNSLQFAVFDIISLDGKPAPTAYAETYKTIESIFGKGKLCHPVETVKAKTCADIEKLFEKWVEKEGAEGVVARSDTAGLFKIKPSCSLDVAVVGFTEGLDDRQGMLHDMLVAVMRPEGAFHLLGRVGGGFTEEQRRDYLSDLKDLAAESEYAEVNEQVAYQMVKPEWVIEINCLDLIGQNTRGAFIDRPVLDFDRKASMYKVLRRLPLASPISPQFVRRREDKKIHPADLRIAQVTGILDVPYAEQNARELTLPKSQILTREVYTKTLKGQLMVRKLLVWQTNKETTGDYPAFVASFTDFSPNRKTPLERDIRVSNSREQMDQLVAAMKAEYIVKGWNPA